MSKHRKNPAAVALGKLARGHKKTMSEAAFLQRRFAAQQPRKLANPSAPRLAVMLLVKK